MSVYRLYSFTNYYLSSLQKGLQTAHVVAEMANINKIYRDRYPDTIETPFETWSRLDKTIIILNGGNSADLELLHADLYKFGIESTFFKEDQRSLNGAWTAVGCIIPDVYWDPKHPERDHQEVVIFRKFLEKFNLAV